MTCDSKEETFVAHFNCALVERIICLYCSMVLYHACATRCRKSEKQTCMSKR